MHANFLLAMWLEGVGVDYLIIIIIIIIINLVLALYLNE